MSEDNRRREPQDRTRINISERNEAEYWSERFNVSLGKLRDAISNVGPMADNVEDYLKSHKGINRG